MEAHRPTTPTLRSLQARMLILSYLAYFFYYFTRKHLAVAKSSLVEGGMDVTTIGYIESAYACCYALGQFISGSLGDRKGPRLALFVGMCLSAIATAAFGFFPFPAVLAICWSLNGLFQATGWPNTCKIVTAWVSEAARGRVMGFWLTCYIVGSMAATAFAAEMMEHFGWREMFMICGGVVMVIGIIQGLFLINRPEDRGYSFGEDMAEKTSGKLSQGFWDMLKRPAVLLLGFAYFGLKYTRYTLFNWLPFYLHEVIRLPKLSSSITSNAFEAGGVVGLIAGGFLADRYFSRNRSRFALIALVGMVAAIFAYRLVTHEVASEGTMQAVLQRNAIAIGVIGCFLYISDAIISGTAPQEIGGAEHAGTVCGIVNGIGSIGQILAGFLPAVMSKAFGWDAVFVSFIAVGIASCLIVLPLALKKTVERV